MKKIAPYLNRIILWPLLLAAATLFLPMLLQGKALFWGTPLLQFVPWWHWAWTSVLAGHMPLWNPLVGMGAPLIANYQSALFYPPNWIYLFLFAWGGTALLAWGQALMVSMHLIWAGLGMALLVRRLGLGVLPQAIVGLAFGFCGYLVSRAGFLSINATVAWLPWILLLLTPRSNVDRFSVRRLATLSLVLAFQLLAGHAQTAWYSLILAGLWSGFWALQTKTVTHYHNSRSALNRAVNSLARAWGWLLVALVLAVLMTGVQLFPTAEYLMESQRAQAVDLEFAMSYSFWPWRLISLFAPGFFGHPAQGDYWGYANYWEDAIYIGMLPLLLALGAVLGNFRRTRGESRWEEIPNDAGEAPLGIQPSSRRNLIWFLVALFVVTLLLALGQNTPVFPWLYRHVPTFDLFQAPTRMMIWGEFALVMLAALGAERWRRPERRGLYWTRLGTAGAFAVTIGAGAAWYMMGDISPTFIRATAMAGMWGLLAGILSLTAPLRRAVEDEPLEPLPLGLWRWCVVLVVALNLIVVGRGANPAVDLDLYRNSPNGAYVRDLAAGGRLYLPGSQEETLKFDRFLRFDSFDPGENWINLRAAMLPNIPMLDDIISVNNFDPLLPGRYVRWMDYLDSAGSDLQPRLLELMDVKLVESVDHSQPYGVRFDPFEAGERVRWVPCALPANDDEHAWVRVMGGEIDFHTSVVLEISDMQATQFQMGENCSDMQANVSQMRILKERPGRIDISIEVPQDGWLVLSDTWYPGWRAGLDGKPVDIYKANYLFRAVFVPAGDHEVQFSYRPLSFWVGLGVSITACCVWLIILWKAGKKDEG